MSVFRRFKRHRKIKRASINPPKLSIVRMLFEHKSCNIFTLTYTASAAEQLYTLTSYVGGKKSDCGFKLNVNSSDIETMTRFFFLPETKYMSCLRGPGTTGKSRGDQESSIGDCGTRATKHPRKRFCPFFMTRHTRSRVTVTLCVTQCHALCNAFIYFFQDLEKIFCFFAKKLIQISAGTAIILL